MSHLCFIVNDEFIIQQLWFFTGEVRHHTAAICHHLRNTITNQFAHSARSTFKLAPRLQNSFVLLHHKWTCLSPRYCDTLTAKRNSPSATSTRLFSTRLSGTFRCTLEWGICFKTFVLVPETNLTQHQQTLCNDRALKCFCIELLVAVWMASLFGVRG